MKPLFLCRALCVTAVVLCCTSFTKVQSPATAKKDTFYYWYTDDTDVFNKYGTTTAEAEYLTDSLNVVVNTNPFGGTPLVDGYINNNYPHTVWASVTLYSH